MQLCSKPRGARGIEPETFRRRGQRLSRPPTTGPIVLVDGPIRPVGAVFEFCTLSSPQICLLLLPYRLLLRCFLVFSCHSQNISVSNIGSVPTRKSTAHGKTHACCSRGLGGTAYMHGRCMEGPQNGCQVMRAKILRWPKLTAGGACPHMAVKCATAGVMTSV